MLSDVGEGQLRHMNPIKNTNVQYFVITVRSPNINSYLWQIACPSGRSPVEIVSSNQAGCIDVCCECCVLLRRGLCDELITRPEESYRLWCVVVCDLETSWTPWSTGAVAPNKKIWQIINLKCSVF